MVSTLFFSLDEGLDRPQKGQTGADRSINFLQLGQSRELLDDFAAMVGVVLVVCRPFADPL
jgi:hypothetical protein